MMNPRPSLMPGILFFRPYDKRDRTKKKIQLQALQSTLQDLQFTFQALQFVLQALQ
jgi:hypothetical protein